MDNGNFITYTYTYIHVHIHTHTARDGLVKAEERNDKSIYRREPEEVGICIEHHYAD